MPVQRTSMVSLITSDKKDLSLIISRCMRQSFHLRPTATDPGDLATSHMLSNHAISDVEYKHYIKLSIPEKRAAYDKWNPY